jgi:AraC-like DNA-binding protein
MDSLGLWKQTIIYKHSLWQRKEQFDLNVDCYTNWVMFALDSGRFRYNIGKESGVAEPGDLIFCPPDISFDREMLSPIALHYAGFDFAGVSREASARLHPPAYKTHPVDTRRVMHNLSVLRQLQLANDPRSVHRKQWMMNDLWQLACDEWEEELQDSHAALAESEDALMNQAAEWLQTHAYTPFVMKELSAWLGLSPVQFTRRFHRAFQMPPSKLVRMLRIHKASGMLLDSDMTLEQIAQKCGYENGFYLSRVFSRSMGMSPSKYREQNRV